MTPKTSAQNATVFPQGKRIAMVVGVNGSTSFTDKPPLKHACDDAQAIARVLEQQGHFEVLAKEVIGEYASSQKIIKAIFDLTANLQKDDLFLFYFSGHGVPVDLGKKYNDVYLVSSDFSPDYIERYPNMHISLKFLRDQLYIKTDAGYVLIILDCCHADGISLTAPDLTIEDMREAFDRYLGERGSEGDTNQVVSLEGLRIAFTAASYRNTALEDEGHGLMTKLILRALTEDFHNAVDLGGFVTPVSLLEYLQHHMPATRQPGWSGASNAKNFFLADYSNLLNQEMIPHSLEPPIVESPIVEPQIAYVHLPRHRNQLYRPRTNEFEKLEQMLFRPESRRRLGLHGMVGMGKSELANQFAQRYRNRFPDGIFWFEASGQSLLEWQEKLAELAISAKCLPPGYNTQTHNIDVIDHFCRYLMSHPNTLLILDDVKNPDTILSYLQRMARDEIKSILIYTSQNPIPSDGFEIHQVGPLSPEDAQYLLVGETPRETVLENSDSPEANAAQEIIRICEAHPLALMNFRSRCKQNPSMKLARLVTIVQSQGSLQALERFGKPGSSFQASWNGLTDKSAQLLFKLAAFYSEKSAIPLWLLSQAAGFAEQDDLSPLVDQLHALNLVTYVSEENILQLHTLWQEFGKIVIQEEAEKGILLLQHAATRLVVAFEDLDQLERYALQSYEECLRRVEVALNYVANLDKTRTEQLTFIASLLEHEHPFLETSGLWPERLPALFRQQMYNYSLEKGHPLKAPQFSTPWLRLLQSAGIEEQRRAVHGDKIVGMAISRTGHELLTASEGSVVWLWDTFKEKTLRRFFYPDSAFKCAAFNTESTMLALGTSKGEIILWNRTDENAFENLYPIPEEPNEEDEKPIEDHPKKKPDDIDEEEERGSVTAIFFSPDNTKVLAGFDGGIAELWRAVKEENAPLLVFKGHSGPITCMAFSEDGELVCTGSEDGTVRLCDGSDATLLGDFRFTDLYSSMKVAGLAFLPDHGYVLSSASCLMERGNTSQTLVITRIWHIATGKYYDFPAGHSEAIHVFAFSPDGHLLLTCDIQNSVLLWAVISPTEYQLLGAYRTAYAIGSVHWMENSRQFLLVDRGGETFLPHFHHVQVENIS